MEWYKAEIGKMHLSGIYHRFYFGKPTTDSQIYDSNTYVRNYTYLGTVEEVREEMAAALKQKNKFSVGEQIEIMKPDGRNVPGYRERHHRLGMAMLWRSAPHPNRRSYGWTLEVGKSARTIFLRRRSEME